MHLAVSRTKNRSDRSSTENLEKTPCTDAVETSASLGHSIKPGLITRRDYSTALILLPPSPGGVKNLIHASGPIPSRGYLDNHLDPQKIIKKSGTEARQSSKIQR